MKGKELRQYVVYDLRGGAFRVLDPLPIVWAVSPMAAAAQFAGAAVVRHLSRYGGDLMIECPAISRARYLYDVRAV